jgi:hypothetical protein
VRVDLDIHETILLFGGMMIEVAGEIIRIISGRIRRLFGNV